ncbi:ABC transporter permease [Streptomyces sp. NPDC050560]|uniref:ABC transporter permease n=1 Tax=Streptomyces sp. NPDC050560 TaxID=3365630 RepID=UPI00379E7FAE
MSATTAAPAGTRAGGVGLRHAARMEWIKLRSLRSPLWALLLVVVTMIGTGVVTMANTEAPGGGGGGAGFDPTNNVLAGIAFGQLVVGAVGVLVVTGEYTTGSIRTTLAAVPNRPLLLGAKAAVFGGLSLVVGEVVTVVTFLVGRAVLSPDVPKPELGDGGVLRAVLLSGLYLPMIGLIGVGLGALVRHTAGALAGLVGVTLVLPAMAAGFTGTTVARFFPTLIAGNSLAVSRPLHDMLSPWAGLGLMCLYTALALAAGAVVIGRRDA